MSELDNLRPEVREALNRISRNFHISADTDTIRAELLRLAKAEFELMLALQDRLGVQDEYAVVAKGWQERAEKADAELAALKARIGTSRLIEPGVQFQVPGYVGKRVRLVVEE